MDFFQAVAVGIEGVNISIDPMTSRNPGYCFVDFTTKELADQVMKEFDSQTILGRPVKVKPGVRSGSGTGRFDIQPRDLQSHPESNKERNDAFAFDRWRRLEHPQDDDDDDDDLD